VLNVTSGSDQTVDQAIKKHLNEFNLIGDQRL
jgi:hypothetical protein